MKGEVKYVCERVLYAMCCTNGGTVISGNAAPGAVFQLGTKAQLL